MADPMTSAATSLPPCDETMWPGYYYADAWTRVRAHKPPGWPHRRPCWCGAKRHRKALPDGKRRSLWRFWR